jgi:hypothetical protein
LIELKVPRGVAERAWATTNKYGTKTEFNAYLKTLPTEKQEVCETQPLATLLTLRIRNSSNRLLLKPLNPPPPHGIDPRLFNVMFLVSRVSNIFSSVFVQQISSVSNVGTTPLWIYVSAARARHPFITLIVNTLENSRLDSDYLKYSHSVTRTQIIRLRRSHLDSDYSDYLAKHFIY